MAAGFSACSSDAGPYAHTEMMHVVERYRRPDLGHLELEMTVEDPGAFTRALRLSNQLLQ